MGIDEDYTPKNHAEFISRVRSFIEQMDGNTGATSNQVLKVVTSGVPDEKLPAPDSNNREISAFNIHLNASSDGAFDELIKRVQDANNTGDVNEVFKSISIKYSFTQREIVYTA